LVHAAVRGVRRLKAAAVGLLEQRYLGVNTGGEIRAQELGFEHAPYIGSSWLVLWELFRSLEVAEDEVFVDIGSGMGRVVLMAAHRPFQRVIGVERSDRLTEVAKGVIARHRHRLTCQDIELLSVDALEWEIPDDLTIVYVYAPFPDEVFGQFVDRLVASIERCPRVIRLIYYFSTIEARQVLLATGRAVRINLRVPWYARSRFEEVSMFRLLPSGWGRRA
jgi:precorrin-6B methylase 2